MSQIQSFQSNRDNLDDWLEGNSASAGSPLDNTDTVQTAHLDQVYFPVPASALPADRSTKSSRLADHYRTVSFPVRHNEPSSFVSALNSTISPRMRRETVVIPGAKKRAPTTRKLPERERYLHPHLRLVIVLSLILTVLLFTTLSLSPVGDGQVDVPVVGGFIQWAQDQQMKMDIAARHDGAPGQGATNTTNAGPTLPKSQYVAIAQAAAQKYGISPIYFVNQIQQESHFDPYAQSDAGAVGIAQFEPTTAASMGINPYDPNAALDGAARYMALLQTQFGGDYAKALAAYNGGSGAVQAAVRNCGSGWLSCMPLQTQSYVVLIMG